MKWCNDASQLPPSEYCLAVSRIDANNAQVGMVCSIPQDRTDPIVSFEPFDKFFPGWLGFPHCGTLLAWTPNPFSDDNPVIHRYIPEEAPDPSRDILVQHYRLQFGEMSRWTLGKFIGEHVDEYDGAPCITLWIKTGDNSATGIPMEGRRFAKDPTQTVFPLPSGQWGALRWAYLDDLLRDCPLIK